MPATLAAFFTAAGVNNALEHDLNGMIGSLDSHVSQLNLSCLTFVRVSDSFSPCFCACRSSPHLPPSWEPSHSFLRPCLSLLTRASPLSSCTRRSLRPNLNAENRIKTISSRKITELIQSHASCQTRRRARL